MTVVLAVVTVLGVLLVAAVVRVVLELSGMAPRETERLHADDWLGEGGRR